jgi:hypothetical protein
MAKQSTPPKCDYSLRRRFFDFFGKPLKWQDYGHGKFTDLETVQKQIKVLASGSKKVEVEFIHEGKLKDYNGNETGKTMIFEKR